MCQYSSIRKSLDDGSVEMVEIWLAWKTQKGILIIALNRAVE